MVFNAQMELYSFAIPHQQFCDVVQFVVELVHDGQIAFISLLSWSRV